MAIDEAVLTAVGEGDAPPTLRFYTWRSPWISLGPSQTVADIDRAACRARGWGVLRRASGGMAVLHQAQVAYALILPSGHPVWAGDLVTSYLRFGSPLQEAFESLGVRAEMLPPDTQATWREGAPALASRVCFGALGAYELVCQGHKLIGNSQVRRRHAAIQHGVIQLSGDQSGLSAIMANTNDAEREALAGYLRDRVGSIEVYAGRPVAPSELAHAIAAQFAHAFNVCLAPAGLAPFERTQADALIQTKYANPEWTCRR